MNRLMAVVHWSNFNFRAHRGAFLRKVLVSESEARPEQLLFSLVPALYGRTASLVVSSMITAVLRCISSMSFGLVVVFSR